MRRNLCGSSAREQWIGYLMQSYHIESEIAVYGCVLLCTPASASSGQIYVAMFTPLPPFSTFPIISVLREKTASALRPQIREEDRQTI